MGAQAVLDECKWVIRREDQATKFPCGDPATKVQNYNGVDRDWSIPAKRHLCDAHWREMKKIIVREAKP